MSENNLKKEYPLHKHIDENGREYWHSHAPGEHVAPDHEHYHMDELGNLFSHVHDHGEPVYVEGSPVECPHVHPHADTEALPQDTGDGSVHSHVMPDGSVVSHQHTQTKAVLNRLSRAIGHLESVKRMVENGRDCTEVLIQLAAVRSALSSTAKVILKDHLEHCISEVEPGNPDQFKALNDAIDRFM